MKESKEARAERQALERWQFCDVLRRAGNRVDEEAKLPCSAYVIDVAVLTPESRAFAIEIQGMGFSHLSRKGWLRDIDKAQHVARAGWVYLPVTWTQMGSGDAIEALACCGVRVEPTDRAVACPHCTASGAGPGKTLAALCTKCDGTGIAATP